MVRCAVCLREASVQDYGLEFVCNGCFAVVLRFFGSFAVVLRLCCEHNTLFNVL